MMKPYNPDAVCPKCGNEDVYVAHVRKGHGERCDWQVGAPQERDYMRRTCKRCHYEWFERPLDIKPSKTERKAATDE